MEHGANNMQTGHVYKILDGVFGIVSYYPKTEVRVRILPEVTSEMEACKSLARTHAGRFVVADTDTRKWGQVIYRARGYALAL